MIRHRIPSEEMEEFSKAMQKIEEFLPSPPQKHIDYMFNVYNNFVKPSYEDDLTSGCVRCRIEVLGKLRAISREWITQK
jgi:hypothetical protein